MKCLQEKWAWGNEFIQQFPTKWNLLRNQGGGDAIASHENLLAIIELGLECSRELPEERTDIKEVAVKLNKIKLKLVWSKHVSFKLVLVNFHALLLYACTLVILWMHYQLSNGFQLSNLWLVFLLIKEDLKNMLMEVGTKIVTQLTLTSYPIPWKEQSYSYYSTVIGNNSKLEWHSWKHS